MRFQSLAFMTKSWMQKYRGKKCQLRVGTLRVWNKVEQSHLIAGAFHPDRGVKLNRTTNQYGCQIQRYSRKLYIQQFKRMPAKMQLKQKQPPSFDLWTDPLYEKAATVLNANMKMAVTIGVKSGASANDELKPQRVRKLYYQSFASKYNSFIHSPALDE